MEQQLVEASAFHFSIQDQIGIVTIDSPNKPYNLLKANFIEALREILGTVLHQQLKGILFVSAKEENFVRGFDLSELEQKNSAELAQFSAQAQEVLREIECLKIPTVAAIHGDCYGLGLELALACNIRVASSDFCTQFALPQVRSGIVPFAGGVWRLTQCVGLKSATELLLTGNKIHAKTALDLGLVHDVVTKNILMSTALSYFTSPQQPHSVLPRTRQWLKQIQSAVEKYPISREYLLERVENKVALKAFDNSPVTESLIKVLKECDAKSMLDAEKNAFVSLFFSEQSRVLRHLEYTTRAMKNQYRQRANVRDVKSVAILGSGFMGAGIAYITAHRANIPVRIKDIHPDGIVKALHWTYSLLQKAVIDGALSVGRMRQQMQLISGGERFIGKSSADMVIEAVYEDLALKQQMVQESEKYYGDNIVFATNTSTLSIAEIASVAKRPDNVIGFHYFNPVSHRKMLEIIPHEETSEQTIATAIHFAIQQGKIPFLVADSPGFFVNRVLTPYLLEAIHCIIDGEAVEFIDRALQEFGFDIGPLMMIDESGLDVLVKSLPRLQEKLGTRFTLHEKIHLLIENDRKGVKNRRGFYLYDKDENRTGVDKSIYHVLEVITSNDLETEQVARRCLLMMLNEAAYCLQENVISSVEEGNVASVLGAFFPSFRGGIYAYMDKIGAKNIVAELLHHVALYGERFTPCEWLIRKAEQEG
ncbi:3-hydroxyacyl-CoA dehydrogenase NAD-binding domain-containing protein [Conservatibacter flavescens]|uniref:enoyl-CoA hydratase n=1 Tax=Conservatibacter flavescens TaxID=28161 RepID=A0A2M8S230_9PAST|nr:3-hydroxyacyl-CoA dehydrogenase NAD-binding domain-containing protein [Conservatibacter flavescens]PJG85185.1 fatty-acid oxidation protein subunit alpha [Conservatibacter flavescens]